MFYGAHPCTIRNSEETTLKNQEITCSYFKKDASLHVGVLFLPYCLT